jgi:phosphatidylserine decarboxylase
VHVNRAPVGGTVERIVYHAGAFLNASLDKASELNERACLVILTDAGERFFVVQIAGLIARRIVCKVREGERLTPAQRFGLIKFGSRVDLYLPQGFEPAVRLGERVFAGKTILARRANNR